MEIYLSGAILVVAVIILLLQFRSLPRGEVNQYLPEIQSDDMSGEEDDLPSES
jgi:hypothetical protein